MYRTVLIQRNRTFSCVIFCTAVPRYSACTNISARCIKNSKLYHNVPFTVHLLMYLVLKVRTYVYCTACINPLYQYIMYCICILYCCTRPPPSPLTDRKRNREGAVHCLQYGYEAGTHCTPYRTAVLYIEQVLSVHCTLIHNSPSCTSVLMYSKFAYVSCTAVQIYYRL